MNITIITGKKGSGKSTYLRELIKKDKTYDGIITICKDRDSKKYLFSLLKKNIELSCCHYDKKMIFEYENFLKVEKYLKKIDSENIIIDEIGWLELEEKGLYNSLKYLLSKKSIKELVISMRFDSYLELIEKFEIKNHKIITIT